MKPTSEYIQTELEYKFINIDVEEIIRKLEANGAEFIFDTVYKIYNHDREEWRSYQGRVRLREGNGTATITYKAEQEDGFDKELEFGIEDIEKAHELMNILQIPLKRKEEKRRIRYELKGVEIDIDFWPDIDPYIEIEGESEEKIKDIVKLIGLRLEDGVKMNAAKIYKMMSGKDMPAVVEFKKDDWRLHRYQNHT